MLEQERQYRHKVALRRIRVTAIAVNKSNNYYIFSVCSRSFSYPTCKAYVSYYILYCILSSLTCLAVSVPGLSILSFKQHDYRKNVTDHKMCVSIFSTNFVRTIFFILRRIQRNSIIPVNRFSYKVPVILFRL